MENTVCLTFKTKVPRHLNVILDDLLIRSEICVDRMLSERSLSSSKYYKEIPCVLSKSLIAKYQRNKKLKSVKNIVLPVCGDKGKQVKIEKGGIRIPAFFKKEVIPAVMPKPIVGFIRQVEFFVRDRAWYMSYSYNVRKDDNAEVCGYVGVDRNSVGNVVTIADTKTGKVKKLGPCTASITKNMRGRRKNLQGRGKKGALKKIKRKQSNRTRDINHKVSRAVVDYAKLHCCAIVLEDLTNIAKGKAKRYVQKSQWSFYQLEVFIKYKASLLGVPVVYVNPAYTSQGCSKCGTINKPNGKKYSCKKCGHVDHRDANAAFNISRLGYAGTVDQTEAERVASVGLIGNPLNWIRQFIQRSE